MRRTFCILVGAVSVAAASVDTSIANTQPLTRPLAHIAAAGAQARNTISGHVFGESRRPVSDVHVELLNDLYSMVGRAKTDGSGHYAFPGIPQGNYKVRVLPYGTDYAEQSQDVNITTGYLAATLA